MQKGLFYQGQITENEVKQGVGYAVFDNGDTFEGTWKNNVISGNGVYVSDQAHTVYEGQFKQGKKEGIGKIYFTLAQSSYQYQGQFQNDSPNGKGRLVYHDKTVYEGQVRNGIQCGFGIYTTPQMKYEGTWKKGVMEGSGTCYWFSVQGQIQSRYTGEYHDGKKHGYGQYQKINGKLLRGEWVEGKFSPGASTHIRH